MSVRNPKTGLGLANKYDGNVNGLYVKREMEHCHGGGTVA
jgi:hypothetical protein